MNKKILNILEEIAEIENEEKEDNNDYVFKRFQLIRNAQVVAIGCEFLKNRISKE